MVMINCAAVVKSRHSDYDEYTCPRRCSEQYYPMCGINQAGDTKVFVNDCYMSMGNCNQLAQQGKWHQLITHFSAFPFQCNLFLFFCLLLFDYVWIVHLILTIYYLQFITQLMNPIALISMNGSVMIASGKNSIFKRFFFFFN